jgi:hypothetical protein
MKLLQIIGSFLYAIRWLLVSVLAIGVPIYIYLAFIAKVPVFGPVNDVELGKIYCRKANTPMPTPTYAESWAGSSTHRRFSIGISSRTTR